MLPNVLTPLCLGGEDGDRLAVPVRLVHPGLQGDRGRDVPRRVPGDQGDGLAFSVKGCLFMGLPVFVFGVLVCWFF